MKNLFIDSNIWLSLYAFSSDDLEEFAKLLTHLDNDIRLFVPQQTSDEVWRNRDSKLMQSLESFKSFSLQFPNFARSYPEYKTIKQEYENLKQKHSEWIAKLKADIVARKLAVDEVIADFFSKTDILPCDDEIIRAAELRYMRGNPPGKDNKYGDAVNWECLLRCCPDNEDLYLISADNDYASVADREQFNLYLKSEWAERKNSKIVFFKTLSAFLNEHAKDIKLMEEEEKNALIEALGHSPTFKNTHLLIAQLNGFTDWTEQQKDALIEAALYNSQVSYIIKDSDIAEFYNKLIERYNSESANELRQILAE